MRVIRERLFLMRHLCAGVMAGLCMASQVRAAHTLPMDALTPERTVQAVNNDIQAGRWVDAVQRVQAILDDPTAKYVQLNDRLMPIRAWINELLKDDTARAAFVAQYNKVMAGTAKLKMSDAVRTGSVTAILQVADRYPWADSIADAPREAVRAAINRGDVTNAQALIRRIPSAANDRQWQEIRDTATDSQLPVVAFSSDWSVDFLPWNHPRSLPVGSRDLVVFSNPLSVVAMGANGRALWTTGKPPVQEMMAAATSRSPQIDAPKDMSLSRPIIWCDLSGQPQVVIARFTDTSRSALRAYRVEDGTVLWDTSEMQETRDLLMMGAPVASGGYVYFSSIRFDPATGSHTIMGCVELTTGKLVFQTDVGETMPDRVVQVRANTARLTGVQEALIRIASNEVDLSMDDHHIYGVFDGWCIAVDRFSGSAKRFSAYPTRSMDMRAFDREKASKKQTLYRRWRNKAWTNGTSVVIAPINSNSVLAYDAITGAEKWKNDSLAGVDILGMFEDRVILGGATMTAMDAKTGATIWQKPMPDGSFAGPSIVDGQYVGMMSERGVSWYSVENGTPVQRRDQHIVNFDNFLKQAPARTAMGLVMGLDYFSNTPPKK